MISYLNLFFENQFVFTLVWLAGFLALLGLAFELRARLGMSLAGGLLAAALGLLNLLYWGCFINYSAAQGLAAAAGLALLAVRRREIREERAAVLGLLCAALFAAAMSSGAVPFAWDEFFWSLFDKHLSQFSSYWSSSSAILLSHIRYMPGAALWHNFFSVPGFYNEGTAYFANAVLLTAVLYYLADRAATGGRLFTAAAVFAAVGAFSEGLFTLYTDQFVGLFMGLALLGGGSFLSGSKNSALMFFLPLTACLLFKETGYIPFFALIGAAAVAPFTAAGKKLEWKKLAAMLAYCLLVVLAWKLYLKSAGARDVVQAGLFSDFSPQAVARYWAVLGAFGRKMLTDYAMLACWLLLALAWRFRRGRGAAGLATVYDCLVVAGFLAIHLLSWFFFTGEADGRGLAAFERYMGSLLLALFVYYFSLLSPAEKPGRGAMALAAALLLWVPVNILAKGIMPSSLFRLVTPHPKQVPLAKKKFRDLEARLPGGLIDACRREPGTKVWFIYQNTIGLEAMMARHLLAPCQVAHYNWSVGDRYYPEDVWTANLDEAAMLEMAGKYPLMVIASMDDKFLKRYGRFFSTPPQNGRAYAFEPGLKKFVHK